MGERASLISRLAAATAATEKAMADLAIQKQVYNDAFYKGINVDAEREKMAILEASVQTHLEEQKRILDGLDKLPPSDDLFG